MHQAQPQLHLFHPPLQSKGSSSLKADELLDLLKADISLDDVPQSGEPDEAVSELLKRLGTMGACSARRLLVWEAETRQACWMMHAPERRALWGSELLLEHAPLLHSLRRHRTAFLEPQPPVPWHVH